MPKYKRRLYVVEAELYKPGMEDGFMDIDVGYHHAWTPEDGEFTRTGGKSVPYIGHRSQIHPGDFIVKEPGKVAYAMRAADFHKKFELVDEPLNKARSVKDLIKQGRDLISEAQTLCKHPVVNGSDGDTEFSGGKYQCDICDALVTHDTVLQAGTIIRHWSRGKLLVTKRFGDITRQDLVML